MAADAGVGPAAWPNSRCCAGIAPSTIQRFPVRWAANLSEATGWDADSGPGALQTAAEMPRAFLVPTRARRPHPIGPAIAAFRASERNCAGRARRCLAQPARASQRPRGKSVCGRAGPRTVAPGTMCQTRSRIAGARASCVPHRAQGDAMGAGVVSWGRGGGQQAR